MEISPFAGLPSDKQRIINFIADRLMTDLKNWEVNGPDIRAMHPQLYDKQLKNILNFVFYQLSLVVSAEQLEQLKKIFTKNTR